MRLSTRIATMAVALLLIGSLTACSDSKEPAANTPAGGSTIEATRTAELPPPADQELYTALLAVGIDYSYGLTPEDGQIEVLESMDGYGSIRWYNSDNSIIVSHRDAGGSWDWVYVDENVNVDSETPDALTEAERDDFHALATAISKAVGKDQPVTEDHTYKTTGGVMQGDYSAGGAPAGSMNLHFATDADGAIGRIDFRVLE